MRRDSVLILLSLLLAPLLLSWVADPLLGKSGYEVETVNQPDDYSGKVVSTVIRRLPEGKKPRKAVLYVHGYNDYFFQDSMGRGVSGGLDFLPAQAYLVRSCPASTGMRCATWRSISPT